MTSQEFNNKSTRAIVTVLGTDKVGIIAGVSNVLAACEVNILDIRQTIMQEFFTMIMIVDFATSELDFATVSAKLDEQGQEMGVQIKIQHEDVFRFMHRI